MNAVAVTPTYDRHLPLGAPDVHAIVRVNGSDLGEPGADVALRLWTPLGATVIALHELSPGTGDLRDRAIRLDDRIVEYAAGRWHDGPREYELVIALPARRAGDEMLATRVSIVVGGELVGQAPIAVMWTDDERLLAAAGHPGPSTSTELAAAAELPTGPSPTARHTVLHEPSAAKPCPACDLRPTDGDRFCERCGQQLVSPQKS